MTSWRTHGVDTVAALIPSKNLRGLARSVTVGPTEAAVVTRDGEITDVFSEGKFGTRGLGDFLRALLGRGPEFQVLITDTSPFHLSFWLVDPGSTSDPDQGSLFGIPALTADGQLITAQVNLSLSVVPGKADLLLWLLRGRQSISTSDIARSIKDELLAKVIALELSKHTGSELRGNEDLLRGVYEALNTRLDSTLSGYGLRLDNFFINWGLSQDELNKIREQQYQAQLKAAQLQKEIAEVEASAPRAPEAAARATERTPASGIPVPWAFGLLVAVGVLIAVPILVVVLADSQDAGGAASSVPASILPVAPGSTPEGGGPEKSPPEAAAPAVLPPTVSSTATISDDGTMNVALHSADIGIKGVSASVSGASGDVTIVVEELQIDDLSVGQLEDWPDHDPYQYLRLSHGTLADKNISDVTIRFAVNKTWLRDRGHGQDEVNLLRFGDTWTALSTTLLPETNPSDLIYQATSPGLSLFAIAAVQKPAPAATATGGPLVLSLTHTPEPTSAAIPTPTATGTPTPTPTASPTPTGTPTPSPAAAPAPSPTPTATPTPTAAPTPTLAPSPTATATPTPRVAHGAAPTADERWVSRVWSSDHLLGVDTANTETTWAVGLRGTIIKTTDKGKTWLFQPSGTTENLAGVVAVDANTAWAVGYHSTILKTTDGATWETQTGAPDMHLFAVGAVDANTVWAVGTNGIIVKTTDGGATWESQTSGTTNDLFDISVLNSETAWAVGNRGILLKTTDGGTTWLALSWGFFEDFFCVAAVDAETAWLVGRIAMILKTTDGGATWSGETYGSTDVLWDVAALDANTVWAVGANGTIVKTTDGGATWKAQASGTTDNLLKVTALDTLSVWAVGDSGVAVRTIAPQPQNSTPTPTPTGTPTPLPEYQLSWSVDPPDSGHVRVAPASDDLKFKSGTVIFLTAECTVDFLSWAGEVPTGILPSSKSISFVMDRNRTLTVVCAEFRPGSPTPTPTPTPTPRPVTFDEDFLGPSPGWDTLIWSEVHTAGGSLVSNPSQGSVSLSATNGGSAMLHTNQGYGQGTVEFTLSSMTTVGSDVHIGWSRNSSFDGSQPSVHINIGEVRGVADVQLWNPPAKAATGFFVSDETHIYRLVWNQGSVELYIDGELRTTERGAIPPAQDLQLWVRVSADPGIGTQSSVELDRVQYWGQGAEPPPPSPVPTLTPSPSTPTPTPSPTVAPTPTLTPTATPAAAPTATPGTLLLSDDFEQEPGYDPAMWQVSIFGDAATTWDPSGVLRLSSSNRGHVTLISHVSMIYGVTEFRARFTPAARWHSADGAKQQFGWTDAVITHSKANFSDDDIADFYVTFAVWDNNPDIMYGRFGNGGGGSGANFELDVTQFHVYRLDWRANPSLLVFVDGTEALRPRSGPGANSGTPANPIQPLPFRIGSLEEFGDSGGSWEIDWIRVWGVPESILGP